jgi:hypothetical protein
MKFGYASGIDGRPDPYPATRGLEEGRMQNGIQGRRPIRHDHQAPCPALLAHNIASGGRNLTGAPATG